MSKIANILAASDSLDTLADTEVGVALVEAVIAADAEIASRKARDAKALAKREARRAHEARVAEAEAAAKARQDSAAKAALAQRTIKTPKARAVNAAMLAKMASR